MSSTDDKKKALALVLDKLDKTYGKGTVMTLGDDSVDTSIEVIPSGSLGLDLALGVGGYPKGRVIEIYGPESSGKTTLTLHAIAEAQKAGADIIGDDEFLKQLEKEVLNFDVLIVTPQYVPKLAKFARLLGPRGLMPNPKAGTVTTNLTKAIKDAKAGKVEYRIDKQSIIHLGIGKVSFGKDKLNQNVQTFLSSLNSHKPASLKGVFIKSITITTTQGPAIKVESTNI